MYLFIIHVLNVLLNVFFNYLMANKFNLLNNFFKKIYNKSKIEKRN